MNKTIQKKYYVYIVQCCDKTYYTGYTTNIEKRICIHNEGKGAKYTRGRIPVTLVWSQVFITLKEALKKEYQIKQLSRREKESLILKG